MSNTIQKNKKIIVISDKKIIILNKLTREKKVSKLATQRIKRRSNIRKAPKDLNQINLNIKLIKLMERES